jgi:hypothetical protein
MKRFLRRAAAGGVGDFEVGDLPVLGIPEKERLGEAPFSVDARAGSVAVLFQHDGSVLGTGAAEDELAGVASASAEQELIPACEDRIVYAVERTPGVSLGSPRIRIAAAIPVHIVRGAAGRSEPVLHGHCQVLVGRVGEDEFDDKLHASLVTSGVIDPDGGFEPLRLRG